jgi:hypothetical protein
LCVILQTLWEPLVEPWGVALIARQHLAGSALAAEASRRMLLASPDFLNVTLTESGAGKTP